jgi:hypothetical protein
MKRLLLFVALIAWSGMASAVVYKWVDAQGKTQYGDRPPDGVHAEVVEILGSRPSSAPSRASTAAPAPSASAAAARPAGEAGKDEQAREQVAQDVAQTRDKQCAEAQERYKKLIEGRRLYKEGSNGERQYLTSDQIDTERVNAKRDIDETCGAQN